jgi:hypothetical protein
VRSVGPTIVHCGDSVQPSRLLSLLCAFHAARARCRSVASVVIPFCPTFLWTPQCFSLECSGLWIALVRQPKIVRHHTKTTCFVKRLEPSEIILESSRGKYRAVAGGTLPSWDMVDDSSVPGAFYEVWSHARFSVRMLTECFGTALADLVTWIGCCIPCCGATFPVAVQYATFVS